MADSQFEKLDHAKISSDAYLEYTLSPCKSPPTGPADLMPSRSLADSQIFGGRLAPVFLLFVTYLGALVESA